MDGNLFKPSPATNVKEIVEQLLTGGVFTLERIVSIGQVTPAGQWYDQPANEWVVLLTGAARLRFQDGLDLEMQPGDFVNIPAHRRHRVEWTDPECETMWLAIHYEERSAG